jgi:uncharacterized protein (TIGR02271 family)
MTNETIVAIYDTLDRAAAAVRDLKAAGVPPEAIRQHAEGGLQNDVSTKPERNHDGGFWSNLFGGASDYQHEATLFDRRLAGGATVVTVQAPEAHIAQAIEILEKHSPIDLEERAAGYGEGSEAMGTATGVTPAIDPRGVDPLPADQTATARTTGVEPAGLGVAGADTAGYATPTTGTAAYGTAVSSGATPVTGDETIPLSEETLAVGKRALNRGTTRVRRYVIETPVQEQVTLRDETVSIDRRPVSEARPIAGTDFTDRVVEVTETVEEPVVSKTARVVEEVVIRKQATDRTETVSDTVRREDVEITKDAGVTTGTAIDPKI